MFANSVLFGLVVFFLSRGGKRLMALKHHLYQLKHLQVLNVSEAVKMVGKIPKYVILQGLITAKQGKADNTIFSIVETVKIRDILSRADQFKPIKWSQLIQRAYRVIPTRMKDIQFNLKDLKSDNYIEVKALKNTKLTGALNEVLSDKVIQWKQDSIIKRIGKFILSVLVNLFPFNILLKNFKFGQIVNCYKILDNQFSLVLGELKTNSQGKSVIQNPKFITKQLSYLQIKLKRKIHKVMLVISILSLIGILLGYQIVVKLLKNYYKQQQVYRFDKIEQDARSEEDKDSFNCIVCFSNLRSIIFKPCKHYGLCYECYHSLNNHKCPICKHQIEGYVYVKKNKNNM